LPSQIKTALVAQVEIKRDQCHGTTLYLGLRLPAVRGFRDAEPFTFQAPSQQSADLRIVIDDK
jgi:hypothetical protein